MFSLPLIFFGFIFFFFFFFLLCFIIIYANISLCRCTRFALRLFQVPPTSIGYAPLLSKLWNMVITLLLPSFTSLSPLFHLSFTSLFVDIELQGKHWRLTRSLTTSKPPCSNPMVTSSHNPRYLSFFSSLPLLSHLLFSTIFPSPSSLLPIHITYYMKGVMSVGIPN